MADGSDRLARVVEGAHEADGLLVLAQVVGIENAARKQQPVIAIGINLLDGAVDQGRGRPRWSRRLSSPMIRMF